LIVLSLVIQWFSFKTPLEGWMKENNPNKLILSTSTSA
jgi:hypothetical protein